MIWIFNLIMMTTIWVLGITIVTQPGMALYSIRKWAGRRSKGKDITIYDALVKCAWCMPSIHSLFGYGLCLATEVIHFEWKILIAYPIIVAGSSFVSGILWTIYEKIEIQRKYLRNVEQLTFFDVTDRKERYQQRINTNNKN